MLAMRERLRGRVLRLWLALGRIQEQGSHWDEALAFYQRGVELDNLAEEFYRRLMICHRERGQQAEALNAYRRCREMLSVVLGVKPSAETEAVRRSVVAG
jgi:DNA-binding SARP family transcriptional activator